MPDINSPEAVPGDNKKAFFIVGSLVILLALLGIIFWALLAPERSSDTAETEDVEPEEIVENEDTTEELSEEASDEDVEVYVPPAAPDAGAVPQQAAVDESSPQEVVAEQPVAEEGAPAIPPQREELVPSLGAFILPQANAIYNVTSDIALRIAVRDCNNDYRLRIEFLQSGQILHQNLVGCLNGDFTYNAFVPSSATITAPETSADNPGLISAKILNSAGGVVDFAIVSVVVYDD